MCMYCCVMSYHSLMTMWCRLNRSLQQGMISCGATVHSHIDYYSRQWDFCCYWLLFIYDCRRAYNMFRPEGEESRIMCMHCCVISRHSLMTVRYRPDSSLRQGMRGCGATLTDRSQQYIETRGLRKQLPHIVTELRCTNQIWLQVMYILHSRIDCISGTHGGDFCCSPRHNTHAVSVCPNRGLASMAASSLPFTHTMKETMTCVRKPISIRWYVFPPLTHRMWTTMLTTCG